MSLACTLALCPIFASTVPSAINSAFNFISSLEIHSRNEVAAVHTKHKEFPCTKQQRGHPKGESFQPEMHLIAYILPWRESTESDNINSARGAMPYA